MGDLIEARKLTRFFDLGGDQRVHAVDKVSLTIGEREIVGLVGESGSGKSTFGKTLLGLHDKTDGEVIFRGEDPATKIPAGRLSKAGHQDADDFSRPLFIPESADDGRRDYW